MNEYESMNGVALFGENSTGGELPKVILSLAKKAMKENGITDPSRFFEEGVNWAYIDDDYLLSVLHTLEEYEDLSPEELADVEWGNEYPVDNFFFEEKIPGFMNNYKKVYSAALGLLLEDMLGQSSERFSKAHKGNIEKAAIVKAKNDINKTMSLIKRFKKYF